MDTLKTLIDYSQADFGALELNLLDNGSLELRPILPGHPERDFLVYARMDEHSSPESPWREYTPRCANLITAGDYIESFTGIFGVQTLEGYEVDPEPAKFDSYAQKFWANQEFTKGIGYMSLDKIHSNKAELALDFWWKPFHPSIMGMIIHESIDPSAVPSTLGRWAVIQKPYGIQLVVVTDGVENWLVAEDCIGSGLQNIRVTISPTYAAISIDGVIVAEAEDLGAMITCDPEVPIVLGAEMQAEFGDYWLAQVWWMQELMIFDGAITPEELEEDSRTEQLVPFPITAKKAVVSLGDGKVRKWDYSTLGFQDETPFDEGLIKLRVNASSSATPVFTGDPLTLAEVQALADADGKYLHIEFSFISDGDTPIALTPGWIESTEVRSLFARV